MIIVFFCDGGIIIIYHYYYYLYVLGTQVKCIYTSASCCHQEICLRNYCQREDFLTQGKYIHKFVPFYRTLYAWRRLPMATIMI